MFCLKKLRSLFLIVFLISVTFQSALAEKVTIEHNGINLVGNINASQMAQLNSGKLSHIALITHGTLAHGKMEIIAGLQELLSENDVASLAMNLSFNMSDREGFYDCKKPHQHKHLDAVDEIAAWTKWLASKGVKKISLIGHSRGGNQTAIYASGNDNKQIDKVVLIAPMVENHQMMLDEYQAKYGKSLKDLIAKAKQAKSNDFIKNIDFIYCKDTSAQAASILSYYEDASHFDTTTLLAGIKRPTLMIAGSEDNVVKDLDKMVEKLDPISGFEFLNIEGAGHMFRDLYLEEMVEAIIEFLNN